MGKVDAVMVHDPMGSGAHHELTPIYLLQNHLWAGFGPLLIRLLICPEYQEAGEILGLGCQTCVRHLDFLVSILQVGSTHHLMQYKFPLFQDCNKAPWP